MFKSLHPSSFAYGVLTVVVLVCAIGAAKNDGPNGPKYDAAPAMGGLGLQIVNHDTNSLYNYKREKENDVVTYRLIEKIDLTLAGKAEISAEMVD